MINLYINQRADGDVTVLDLKGRLRVGGNALAFHKSVRSLILEKRMLILLNLADVSFVDSCGLGELVASQISVEAKGGKIKLVGTTSELSEILAFTRLDQVFDIYATEAEALQSFADDSLKLEKPQRAFA